MICIYCAFYIRLHQKRNQSVIKIVIYYEFKLREKTLKLVKNQKTNQFVIMYFIISFLLEKMFLRENVYFCPLDLVANCDAIVPFIQLSLLNPIQISVQSTEVLCRIRFDTDVLAILACILYSLSHQLRCDLLFYQSRFPFNKRN